MNDLQAVQHRPVPAVNHLPVACRFCHASVGEHCSLGKGRAHPSRIEDAALALGFSEAEAAEIVRVELIAMVQRYRRDTGASGLSDAQNHGSGETSDESDEESLANTTSEA